MSELEARRILKAMSHRDGSWSEQTWFPIETAPKDGTPILGFGEKGEVNSEWVGHVDDWDTPSPNRHAMAVIAWAANSVQGWWAGYYGGTDPLRTVTHWQPLPEPPPQT